ncbi:efflux RND transporter permease subunit [uncultured Bacteroides sp.]|uniref:efflux RND transporter permease subunit n=1 Tax=uncultured Bacteroides sp. TaxID=162156 RepID=UPI002AAACE6F|nr:efflux RND transporter permease subunit [uncultured Bacteroides sp.]
MLKKIIKYFLENRLVTAILLIVIIVWGLATAPFNWHGGLLPRDPVAVDAIPDVGDNQQIVATEWMGRSPKDIQDQITYPLTTSLLGIPGVKTIRSTSMFGMSFIYIIFNDNVEFYWSRSRILEKLNSLPLGILPEGVQPSLGPDATALGQIFWYTLEGRDSKTGKPTGGWDPQELRTIQDYYVKYSLSSAEGVSEVASVGGYVKEFQVDLNPEAMRSFGVSVMDVMEAVKKSNLDIGAETIEINKVEYLIRGLGYIKNLADLENAAITSRNNVPVRIKDVATVNYGPATRRGGLDKEGMEAVGAVVVARYGSNPMDVINSVKDKIKETAAGMPQKVLPDGRISKVTIVPFYDRTQLIKETIGTLESALTHEILICIIVVIVLIVNLRASIVIAGILPLAVLCTFIIMRNIGIEANIVALSGIAIAIGVMVDVGIVFMENVVRHLDFPENRGKAHGQYLVMLIYNSVTEVAGAISTAMLTTIISFIPVFAMQAQEGKMFHPLAYTKTFALASAFILGLVLLPTLAYWIFSLNIPRRGIRKVTNMLLIAAGIFLFTFSGVLFALVLTAIGINNLLAYKWKPGNEHYPNYINIGITLLTAVYLLSSEWLPLGPQNGILVNMLFVAGIVAVILALLWSLVIYYERILRWCLANRWKFISIPIFTALFGLVIWMGFDKTVGFVAKGFETAGWNTFRKTTFWSAASNKFPGIGKEFMPSLDEGSYLLMPTSMPHSGVEQNLQNIEKLDRRLKGIPEVELAVGKWGRVNSALDPAPIQMYENTINYRPEYMLDDNGQRARFKVDRKGRFMLIGGKTYDPEKGFRIIPKDSLIPYKYGEYYRQWRPQIKNKNDIWNEIVKVTHLPGLTSAPKLQPIATRMVMLSTGMRAPMGLKVYGPDLESIEKAGKMMEKALKEVPSVLPASVFYDRAVGAPYLEIKLNRENMARYGVKVSDLQEVIGAAVGGMKLSTSVEGRERFPIRLRYARELRDNPQSLGQILIPTSNGVQVPLNELADINYAKGAQMIQSENTFLLGYVIFDKVSDKAEVDVVNEAQKILDTKIKEGKIVLPKGVTYKFAGNYEQQVRATNRLLIVIPISLILILLILYFRFKSVTASFIHFSGVFVAFAGGFILIWLYGQEWFLNFSIAGMNMRNLFQMHTINLSVAVWVGFIALFGIATNDGVLMGTYIHQMFLDEKPTNKDEIREAVVKSGLRRVRAASMTTAATLIALLPVLTSTGKGSDIMVPMAIPTFGGMLIQTMTMFVVPVLQCWWREHAVKHNRLPEQIETNYSIQSDEK